MLLLSFPGINVVTAAEFAAEMGPISHSPATSRSPGGPGSTPRGTRAIEVDHTGPLVPAAIARCGTCSC